MATDMILRLLENAVDKWYDEHYQGVDLVAMKKFHLRALERHYFSDRFIHLSGGTIQEEIHKFLTEVQELVNTETAKWG